jgi:ankyrin repeat protein
MRKDSCSQSQDSSVAEIPFSVCAEVLYCCATGDIAAVKALIKQYVSFHWMVAYTYFVASLIRCLFQPALVNYAYPHCFRQTPLHIAAKSGDFTMVKFLVQQGGGKMFRNSFEQLF